jgi:hypothetical protein
MMYGIGFTISQRPHNHSGLSFRARLEDIGHEFNLPSDDLPGLNEVLTHNGALIGSMRCCNGDVGTINSAGLTVGTERDKVMITRFAPPLGLNFFGYHITNLTMTVDRLQWIPISSNQFRAETAYTARIYGIPEPFALSLAWISVAVGSLRIRLARR